MFWQAHSGICQKTFQHPDSQVNALELTQDGQLIAAGGYQHVRTYDVNSNNSNPVMNFEGISKNVTAVGFNDEGKWMFTGSEDCSAKIWDLRGRSPQCQRIFQVGAPVSCACLHPSQSELIVGDHSGIIHIWNLRTDHNEQLIPEQDAFIQHVSIDPEGTYMAAVTNKGHCYVWSLSGGRDEAVQLHPKHKIAAHQRYGLKCRFSPDSTLLVTTSADQTAKVWRTTDFSLVAELKEEGQRWVWDVAFSADGQYVFTSSSDNMARLWSIETGQVKREYSGHQKPVTCIAFRDNS